MEQLKLEMVSVDKLLPNPKNPRTHSDSQVEELRASIREFGFINPLLVDGKYNIIAGHGRLMAATLEKYTELPCISVEGLTKTQIKAYIIADNKLALNAGWNDDWLKADLTELKDEGFDLGVIGFSDEEFNDLMYEEPEPEEDDFDVDEELAKPAICAPGDVWQLDQHRVMCGDSTSQEQVDKLMDGKKAQIIWTDPPWNVDYGSNLKPGNAQGYKPRKIMNDKMTTSDFCQFLTAAFTNARDHLDPGGIAYVAMSAQEWGNMMQVMSGLGFHWSSTIIWAKDQLVLSRKDYHTQYEPLWYGWLEGTAHKSIVDRKQSDLWEIPRPKRSDSHPTMKPIELIARSLENSSKPKQLVQDLFGGSGSVLIAAEQLDRACYTMELDTKYCDVIIKRWEEYTGKKAVRVNG